jgi:murein DD-endopeptidase MepM/ murein hydrolase activator NlpD
MTRREKGSGALIISLIVFSAVATVISYMVFFKTEDGIFESNKPTIEFDDSLIKAGVGLNPFKVPITLKDAGIGLDEVIIRLGQFREQRDIFKKKFEGAPQGEVNLEVGGNEFFADEGDAIIEIKVWDKSFWSNNSDVIIPIKIDKTTPKISVLTSQHNGQEGGSQLVFYRASDQNLAASGAVVGVRDFIGAKAEIYDPAINLSGIFGAIYTVTPGQGIKESAVNIFAEDSVGNRKTGKFYNKIAKRNFKKVSIKLPTGFSSAEAQRLLEKVRAEEDKKIRDLLAERGLTKFKVAHALMPVAGAPYFRFGETITFLNGLDPASTFKSTGFRMESNEGASVFASAEGTVMLAEDLPFYGKTVIVDHGAGISTVYAGMGSINASLGEEVTPERAIGSAGQSGFFFRPGVFFELRVQGEPSNPLEWWDAEWVKTHIFDKITEIKKLLGVTEISPL